MSDVEYIRQLCADRKIPVSTLEKECGFANGYLNPKKAPQRIPYDRAVRICQYLTIPLSDLGYPDTETVFKPSETEMQMILSFRRLTVSNQKTILDNIDFFLSKQDEEKKESVTV